MLLVESFCLFHSSITALIFRLKNDLDGDKQNDNKQEEGNNIS